MSTSRGEIDQEVENYLTAAQRGSQAGFTGLYRVLGGRVAGYLRSRGVREVDDVVNEVFLGAFRNLASFQGGGAEFRRWIFAIAWNKSSDWHRAAERRPKAAEVDADFVAGIAGGDVEIDAMDAMADANVGRLLAGLTTDQREVVVLRIVAQLSLAEVAEIIGKPVGAVKSLQHRALVALQKRISRQPVSL